MAASLPLAEKVATMLDLSGFCVRIESLTVQVIKCDSILAINSSETSPFKLILLFSVVSLAYPDNPSHKIESRGPENGIHQIGKAFIPYVQC